MQEEELRMFALFEMTPDLVCIVNREGYFKKINPAVVKKLGYPEEELYACPVSTFIHPDDKERTRRERVKLLNDQPLLNFQNRYVSKSREVVWLEWTSIYLPDKEIVFAIAKDITARKLVELELEENYKKFKSLTAHFKNNIEKDRRYFAVELHEDLAQLATVVKIDLEWLHAHVLELPDLAGKRLEHALQTSGLLIDKIRKIAYTISPDTIADLGLNDVLQGLCTEFSSISGISCQYKSSFDETRLSHEIKLDIFRICQEALLNVMKHAQASQAEISVMARDGKIHLSITDNGKGLGALAAKQASGLTALYNRALSINSELCVDSSDKGTTVKMII